MIVFMAVWYWCDLLNLGALSLHCISNIVNFLAVKFGRSQAFRCSFPQQCKINNFIFLFKPGLFIGGERLLHYYFLLTYSNGFKQIFFPLPSWIVCTECQSIPWSHSNVACCAKALRLKSFCLTAYMVFFFCLVFTSASLTPMSLFPQWEQIL